MAQKTIAHYLADLAIDLKVTLDTELSTAQLTRCIEKAVADFSRFRPREKSLELVVDAEVASESVTTPAASDPDYFVDNDDISAIDDGDLPTMTATHRPDVPRPVLITVTDADTSITQLVIIVKGYDTDNKYIEEHFYLEGGLVQTGKKYFAWVDSVEIDEITGEGTGDKLDVGTGAANGVFVALGYKPIKPGSLSSTGLTLETDFLMDYAGGRIAMKSGGSMAAATAYTVKYTKSRLEIDLDSIIDDLIKVDRVEYPVGKVPQQFSKMELWGNILTLAGGFETQEETTDKEHLIIRYFAPHSPPDAQSSGSFPRFLDTTIQLAASAYALFILALQYEHQAVTDLASLRTELGLTTAVHALADAALDKAAVLVTASTGKIDLALAKVALYLETAGVTDNAVDVLGNITDDAAELRDKITVASTAMATILDKVETVDLDAGAPDSAVESLKKGEDKIDVLNDGEQVPALHADYARAWADIATARVQAAMAYGQEIAFKLDNIRTYVEEAGGWTRLGEVFIAEAQALIGQVNAIVAEAETWIAQIDRFLAEAAQYQELADRDLLLAGAFRAEAIERRNEAWAIWRDFPQYAPAYSLGARSQMVNE